jgi:hypothetical protein
MTDVNFLAGLTATTAELPKRVGGRGRKVKDNPFTAWVSDSYATQSGRSVTIPGANAKDATYLVRSAAGDLGLGVRIVVTDSKGKTLDAAALKSLEDKKSTAQVKVLFQGQDKRNYTPRKSKDVTPETPAS